MASPFQNQRSDDAIIITPQVSRNTQDTGEQIFKKPKTLDSSNSSNSTRRQASLFFKTRLCVKFKSGTCPNGVDCNFAHGSEDLRRPPPNWQELANKDVNNNVVSEEQLLNRNRICRKYYRGEICNYGERCTFVHVEPRSLAERSVSDFGDANGVNGLINENIVVVGAANNSNLSANNNGNGYNHQKGISWKTRMCNKWEATGSCPFGEKCHFAHGHAELLGQKNQTDLDKANSGTMAAAAAAAAPSKTHHLPTTSTEMGTNTSTDRKLKVRGLVKFKGVKRISSIYADWIDDPFFST